MLMATLIKPDILLLDEHAAALDPRTARQILDLTTSIVSAQQITTLMVTHNMNHALTFGNRLIMLHRGKIIFDIQGEEKAALKKEDLIGRFYDRQKEELSADRMLLG
jgi:putative ABC transport system ATP-binding protein